MKTILIPVDFTATTGNTVSFGAEWCKKYEYDRIILLKTFYNNVFDQIVVSAEYFCVSQDYMKEEREEARDKMEEISVILTSRLPEHVTISTAFSEEPLVRAVLEITNDEKADLIILGSNNYNYSGDSLIANNVISIAKVSPVRVFIVPVTYTYEPVRTALLPCDFSTLVALDKLQSLRTSPLWGTTNLLALNVDPKERYLQPDEQFRKTEINLHDYLKNFSHTIHFSNDRNIIKGIINFIRLNEIQLIISMPGKHSFLYSLTHKSISEAIYLNAREPVLILK